MSARVPMLIRMLSIIGAILCCYYWPSDYPSQYLTLERVKENTAHSFYLCLFVSIMWMERSALCIIIIEAFLIICNLYVAYHFHTGTGIFANYYSSIQFNAFLLELLVMGVFTSIELIKIGREDSMSHFYRSMLDRRYSGGNRN